MRTTVKNTVARMTRKKPEKSNADDEIKGIGL